MSWNKIDEITYSFDDSGVKIFLLIGNEYALLIDSGMNIKNIKDLCKEITDLPIRLINTHADIDHISANEEFEEFMISPHELVNYSKKYNLNQIIPIYDGDIIDLGNRNIQIIELPGHTPGSIGLLDNYGNFFSGDPIQDGHIFMFGQMRNMNAYIISLRKLLKYENQIKHIYPSHGTCPIDYSIVPLLIKEATIVINNEVEGHKAEKFGKEITIYNVGITTFLCE